MHPKHLTCNVNTSKKKSHFYIKQLILLYHYFNAIYIYNLQEYIYIYIKIIYE